MGASLAEAVVAEAARARPPHHRGRGGLDGRPPRRGRAHTLRIAVHELDAGEVPQEVAINEAVALAKRYATDEAGKLVNGILGRIQRETTEAV